MPLRLNSLVVLVCALLILFPGLSNARYYDSETGRFLSVDPALDEASRDFLVKEGYYSITPYNYAKDNPLIYNDPTGKFWDIVIDVGAVVYDIYDIASTAISGQDVTATQWTALSADVVATLVPFATGAGAIVRAAAKADDVVDAVRAVNKATDSKKTYQTYTKTNPKTGEVYTGRTSGKGTPEQNVARRDKNHHMNKEGFERADLEQSSPNKDAIRGREQNKIDQHGGAKSQGGTSGNKINGISPKNPKKQHYLDEAKKEFGGGQ